VQSNRPSRDQARGARVLRLSPLLGLLALVGQGCSALPTPRDGAQRSGGSIASLFGKEGAAAAPAPPASQADAEPLRLGDGARSSGDFAGAAVYYRRAHDAAPQALDPLLRLGAVLVDLKAYAEALDAYRAAATLAPGDTDIAYRLGGVYLVLEQPQAALEQFRGALATRDTDPLLYNALGVTQSILGQIEPAQASYKAGLRIAPTHLGLRNNLGLSQMLAGDYAAAVATLEALVALPGATARHRQNLALAYALKGDADKAMAVARIDLDEAAAASTLAYYRSLATMDQHGRALDGATLLGVHFSRAATARRAAASVAGAPIAASDQLRTVAH
jgi:Flp pilus assembly protein TadD